MCLLVTAISTTSRGKVRVRGISSVEIALKLLVARIVRVCEPLDTLVKLKPTEPIRN